MHNNLTMPKKLLIFLVVLGKESCIALTFPGSGKIPFDENTKPKNVREFCSVHIFHVSELDPHLQIFKEQCATHDHGLADSFHI